MKTKKSTLGDRMNSGGVVIISTPKEPKPTKQPSKATTQKPKK